MAKELIYTSSERGLRPGTRGFCTVAYTTGMRADCVQLLESLSAYRDISQLQHCSKGPTAFSHYRYTLTGSPMNIVSRIGPAKADHTYRSNKIAHHVVLSAQERPAGGPAWLCAQEDFFCDVWNEEPHRIAVPKPVPRKAVQTTKADHWEKYTGDAGWAGVLAESFMRSPNRIAAIIYPLGTDVLSLFLESSLLLPESKRWQITFNTYFTFLPTGANCVWRGCLLGSEAERDVRRNSNLLLIDLTKPMGKAPESPLTTAARQGIAAAAVEEASSTTSPKFMKLADSHRRALRMKPQIWKDSVSDDA